MRKLRADSTFNGLSAGQREQVLNWLFDDGLSYPAVSERILREFGAKVSAACVGRYYRYAAEDRRVGNLALAGGSMADFRLATRKLLGMATLNAATHQHANGDAAGLKAVIALTKLMLKDQAQERSEQRLALELERRGMKR